MLIIQVRLATLLKNDTLVLVLDVLCGTLLSFLFYRLVQTASPVTNPPVTAPLVTAPLVTSPPVTAPPITAPLVTASPPP